MANIRLTQSAKDSIADRVHEHVGIRMSIKSFVMRNLDSAQDELASLDQSMDVVTDADSIHLQNYMAHPAGNQAFCRDKWFPSSLTFRDQDLTVKNEK